MLYDLPFNFLSLHIDECKAFIDGENSHNKEGYGWTKLLMLHWNVKQHLICEKLILLKQPAKEWQVSFDICHSIYRQKKLSN